MQDRMLMNDWGNDPFRDDSNHDEQSSGKLSILKRLLAMPVYALINLSRILSHPKYACYKLLDLLAKLVKIAQFVHLIRFYAFDASRNLAEQLTGVRLVKTNKQAERWLDFTLLNRIVVWSAIGKALTKLLSLLVELAQQALDNQSTNIASYLDVQGFLVTASKLFMFSGLSQDDVGGGSANKLDAASALEKCAVCGTKDISMPCVSYNG